MPTLSEIVTGLSDALKTVKTANGYQTDLPDANIYSSYTDTFKAAKADDKYPKACILLDEGDPAVGLSGSSEENVAFIVVFITKKLSKVDAEPQEKLLKFIEDVRKLFKENNNLSGLVTEICLGTYTTDAGIAHPEGAVVIRLPVRYYLGF
jgi:hypothetical protein